MKATKTQSSLNPYQQLFWELQLTLRKSEKEIKINFKSGINNKMQLLGSKGPGE